MSNTSQQLETILTKKETHAKYKFYFTIEPRIREMNYKGLKVMNGESAFGPSENWPAQIEPFGGYIAEEVKKGNLKVNDELFTEDSLVNLFKKYPPSLFTRSYISEKEVAKTFSLHVEYLEAGLLTGVIEQHIQEEFATLPFLQKMYFKTFKNQGKKFIDALVDKEPTRTALQHIGKTTYGLHVRKYEVLGDMS